MSEIFSLDNSPNLSAKFPVNEYILYDKNLDQINFVSCIGYYNSSTGKEFIRLIRDNINADTGFVESKQSLGNSNFKIYSRSAVFNSINGLVTVVGKGYEFSNMYRTTTSISDDYDTLYPGVLDLPGLESGENYMLCSVNGSPGEYNAVVIDSYNNRIKFTCNIVFEVTSNSTVEYSIDRIRDVPYPEWSESDGYISLGNSLGNFIRLSNGLSYLDKDISYYNPVCIDEDNVVHSLTYPSGIDMSYLYKDTICELL